MATTLRLRRGSAWLRLHVPPTSACEWHLSSCCPLEELVLGLHKCWIRGAIDISAPYQLVHLRVSSTRNGSFALELWSHANAFATGRSLQVQELLQGRTRGAVDVVSKDYFVHLRRASSTAATALLQVFTLWL